MEDLIDITNYCDTVLVKYGEHVDECNAIFLEKENILECRIKYRSVNNERSRFFQYQIANFNFLMTDTEVLVNRSSIEFINDEINRTINKMKAYADL